MTPGTNPPARPSIWYRLLGVPFLLGGIGFVLYTVSHALSHITDSLTQVVIPGRVDLMLKGDVDYTIFLERQTVINGMVYVTESVEGLQCRVRSMRTGRDVPVSASAVSTTYSLGSRSGQSILAFHTPQEGRYEMACDYGGGSGSKAVLAIGTGLMTGLLRTAVVSIVSMLLGVGGFVVVVLTVLNKRRRSGRRLLGTY